MRVTFGMSPGERGWLKRLSLRGWARARWLSCLSSTSSLAVKREDVCGGWWDDSEFKRGVTTADLYGEERSLIMSADL